jgi:peptidoglycan/xylan/chitin deacetylase (PgdA/CDA1 family)
MRDLVGYANRPPTGRWPNGARLAVSIVVNYEEGSERSRAMGDPDQETMTEWGNYPMPPEIRNLAMESMYEYDCYEPIEHTRTVAEALVAAGYEIRSHGYRWEEECRLTEEEEREHIRLAVESFKKTCGKRPIGWYCRYGPSIRTRRLVVEEGGFLYDCDAYNDDVPYFVEVSGKRHLVVPYTPDINDFCFWNSPGFVQADDFFRYLKESFEVLYAESAKGPRIMSIGLHPRIIGRAGRVRGLRTFIEYAKQFSDVWFATREEIARAWLQRAQDQ